MLSTAYSGTGRRPLSDHGISQADPSVLGRGGLLNPAARDTQPGPPAWTPGSDARSGYPAQPRGLDRVNLDLYGAAALINGRVKSGLNAFKRDPVGHQRPQIHPF